eukprot:scaffold22736_cov111-Cylindrotheca_fusiformis.AAC.6
MTGYEDSVKNRSTCQQWNDTVSCSSSISSLSCVWDEVSQTCILLPFSPHMMEDCFILDTSTDCNVIPGCEWVEDDDNDNDDDSEQPVWLWLAINIPVWFLGFFVCTCCYHKKMNTGNSVLPLTNRSYSNILSNDDQEQTANSKMILWCWKEASRLIDRHPPESIVGGTWIKYDAATQTQLEAAYQKSNNNNNADGGSDCQLLSDYRIVSFQFMIQVKITTGFQRKVVRIDLRKAIENYVWCWKEVLPSSTATMYSQYSRKSRILIGRDGWIQFENHLNLRLEAAFQIEGVTECTLLDDDVVDFETMQMTNIYTEKQCRVQRMPRMAFESTP